MTNAELITELAYCANIEKRKLLSDASDALEAAEQRIKELESQAAFFDAEKLNYQENIEYRDERIKELDAQKPKESKKCRMENETYKKLYGDLLEEHCELLRRLPKSFVEPKPYRYCPYCGGYGIHLECNDAEFHVRGVHVKCFELVARCFECGEEIYIPTINDWNCENREYAYQNAKTEREENDDNLR